MTIFLEISKQLLLRKLRSSCDESTTADQSTINHFRSLFNAGRDTTLSAAKRVQIESLISKIESYEDEHQKDDASLKALIDFLKGCLKEIETARAGHPIGKTEPILERLQVFLQSAFDRLRELNLLNTPHDEDPLNTFRFHQAYYCIEKKYSEYEMGMLEQLTKEVEFRAKQEILLVEAFRRCIKYLEAKSPQHPLYAEAKLDHIFLHIIELQQHNKQLCADYSLFGVLLSDDKLNRCLDRALIEIIEDMDTCCEAPIIQAILYPARIKLLSPEVRQVAEKVLTPSVTSSASRKRLDSGASKKSEKRGEGATDTTSEERAALDTAARPHRDSTGSLPVDASLPQQKEEGGDSQGEALAQSAILLAERSTSPSSGLRDQRAAPAESPAALLASQGVTRKDKKKKSREDGVAAANTRP